MDEKKKIKKEEADAYNSVKQVRSLHLQHEAAKSRKNWVKKKNPHFYPLLNNNGDGKKRGRPH